MGLKIQRTGLEQFAPGGTARLKMLVVGGPGIGKTRMATYWPLTLFLDCEGGMASTADRGAAYTRIKNSQDMLDALAFLKTENMRPWAQRQFQTVCVDTLDSYARLVQDEWLQRNPNAESFRGYEAWGYLESKMQMLTTRLLNLDMNVIVNCHYKEKTIKEGVGDQASERQELALQLQGSTKDTIFNDLDLACFMGGYYAAVDGQRVRKRGLTFKATPERPFLKDRLGIMPDWMEVTFSENDYLGLFDRLNERIAELDKAGANAAEIGEIPPATDSFGAPPVTDAAPVGPLSGGPLPQQSPAEAPLASRSKVELVTIARDMGLNPKGNALKSELIEAIDKAGGLKKWQEITEAKDSGTDAPATAKTETPPDDASPTSGTESPSSTDGPVQDAVPSSGDSKSAPVNVDDELTDAASETFTEDDLNEAANLPQCMKADGGDLCVWDKDHGGLHSWESPTTDAGEPVNTTTGEIGQKAQQVAANNAAVEEPAASAAPAEKPKLSTPAPGDRPANCSQCGNDIKAVPPVELTGGEPLSPVKVESYLRVAFIKARNHICCTCFLQRQKKSA